MRFGTTVLSDQFDRLFGWIRLCWGILLETIRKRAVEGDLHRVVLIGLYLRIRLTIRQAGCACALLHPNWEWKQSSLQLARRKVGVRACVSVCVLIHPLCARRVCVRACEVRF